MLNLKLTAAVIFVCAVTCGATFLLALYRQFAYVEVAASLVTMIEVYLLSSSIGELIEGHRETRAFRAIVAVTLAALILISFTFFKFKNH